MTEAEQLAADKARLAQEQIAFAQQQAAARKAHTITFVDGIIAAGKLATGHKDAMVAFMMTIPASGDAATFEFAQGEKTEKVDATEWFKGFLGALPKIVPTGEHAPHDAEFARNGGKRADGELLDPGEIYAIHNKKQG